MVRQWWKRRPFSFRTIARVCEEADVAVPSWRRWRVIGTSQQARVVSPTLVHNTKAFGKQLMIQLWSRWTLHGGRRRGSVRGGGEEGRKNLDSSQYTVTYWAYAHLCHWSVRDEMCFWHDGCNERVGGKTSPRSHVTSHIVSDAWKSSSFSLLQ